MKQPNTTLARYHRMQNEQVMSLGVIGRHHAPKNMAVISRFVMNLVKIDTTLQTSMKRKRQMAGWDDEVRAKLLFRC